jgi:uncharacterized cupredoxin-like copper-binding protein
MLILPISTKNLTIYVLSMIAISIVLVSQSHAAGKGHHDHHGHDKDKAHIILGGEPGKKSEISRTIEIIATDDLKFNIPSVEVKDGETIKFVVINKGESAHDFTIGTPEIQVAHQKEMSKMMEAMSSHEGHKMNHNDPNALFLNPGETKELIWKFKKTSKLEFGCNVPGHYQAGMMGKIKFKNM